ncbi:hypothetical protein Daura_25300 [Dactylosporangium aurantiacum]|uniref:Uncharacterized protein n=1 Tax=Dactylosporangium aurantiacum TaxID=35754 RepID=A0A9Q9IRJ2_9ACTN|nr:hypothetical protein [Dactylosporangium aurantiacum]MDG6107937.1 hypothetical protein [Dactylosporangium aurantiacum]UWZ60271.1 hypothetical protein Daura_25300 [Dactylosporangium aurantiacum]
MAPVEGSGGAPREQPWRPVVAQAGGRGPFRVNVAGMPLVPGTEVALKPKLRLPPAAMVVS